MTISTHLVITRIHRIDMPVKYPIELAGECAHFLLSLMHSWLVELESKSRSTFRMPPAVAERISLLLFLDKKKTRTLDDFPKFP